MGVINCLHQSYWISEMLEMPDDCRPNLWMCLWQHKPSLMMMALVKVPRICSNGKLVTKIGEEWQNWTSVLTAQSQLVQTFDTMNGSRNKWKDSHTFECHYWCHWSQHSWAHNLLQCLVQDVAEDWMTSAMAVSVHRTPQEREKKCQKGASIVWKQKSKQIETVSTKNQKFCWDC